MGGDENYEASLEVHRGEGRDLLFFSDAQPVSLPTEVFQVYYDIYDLHGHTEDTPMDRKSHHPWNSLFLDPFQPLQICSLIAGAIAVAPVRVNNTSNSRHKRELSLLKANSVIKTLLVQQGWTQKWIKTAGCYSRMLPKLSLCISASNATSTGLQKGRRAKKDLWLGEGSAVIPVRTTCY